MKSLGRLVSLTNCRSKVCTLGSITLTDWFEPVLVFGRMRYMPLCSPGVVSATVPIPLVTLTARLSGSVAPKTHVDMAIDSELLSRPWTTLVAARWRHEEHINRLELLSVSTAV